MISCFPLPDHGITHVTCTGDLSLEMMTSTFRCYMADPLVPRPHRLLADLSRTTSIDLSYRETENLVRFLLRELLPEPEPPRIALVVPSPTTYAIGQLFALLARPIAGFKVSLHRSLDEAADALELPSRAVLAA